MFGASAPSGTQGTGLFGLSGPSATSGQPSQPSLFGGSSLFGTSAPAPAASPGGSLFGTSAPAPAASPGGNLFGSSSTGVPPNSGTGTNWTLGGTGLGATQGATAKPSWNAGVSTGGLFGASTGLPGSSSSGGGLFSQSSTKPQPPQGTAGAKTFLPGRPSLHDILSVAPQWKEAFESVCKDLTTRDSQIQQLRDVIRDLRSKNETHKVLLAEKVEIARADMLAQNCFLAEIEAQQPAVRKWRRQVNSLSTACQRTVGSDTTTPQPLIVPQSDYLRFVDELQKRFQRIEKRAQSLEQATNMLQKELQGETPSIDEGIKDVLMLLMSEYKLLKYSQLGLHEELKSSIDRYKYTHPRTADLDQQLDESLRADGIVHSSIFALLGGQSKPSELLMANPIPPSNSASTPLRGS